MRVFTEASIYLSGDKDLARRNIPLARTLLGIMKAVNTKSNTYQRWRRTLPDGTKVDLYSIFNRDYIILEAFSGGEDDEVFQYFIEYLFSDVTNPQGYTSAEYLTPRGVVFDAAYADIPPFFQDPPHEVLALFSGIFSANRRTNINKTQYSPCPDYTFSDTGEIVAFTGDSTHYGALNGSVEPYYPVLSVKYRDMYWNDESGTYNFIHDARVFNNVLYVIYGVGGSNSGRADVYRFPLANYNYENSSENVLTYLDSISGNFTPFAGGTAISEMSFAFIVSAKLSFDCSKVHAVLWDDGDPVLSDRLQISSNSNELTNSTNVVELEAILAENFTEVNYTFTPAQGCILKIEEYHDLSYTEPPSTRINPQMLVYRVPTTIISAGRSISSMTSIEPNNAPLSGLSGLFSFVNSPGTFCEVITRSADVSAQLQGLLASRSWVGFVGPAQTDYGPITLGQARTVTFDGKNYNLTNTIESVTQLASIDSETTTAILLASIKAVWQEISGPENGEGTRGFNFAACGQALQIARAQGSFTRDYSYGAYNKILVGHTVYDNPVDLLKPTGSLGKLYIEVDPAKSQGAFKTNYNVSSALLPFPLLSKSSVNGAMRALNTDNSLYVALPNNNIFSDFFLQEHGGSPDTITSYVDQDPLNPVDLTPDLIVEWQDLDRIKIGEYFAGGLKELSADYSIVHNGQWVYEDGSENTATTGDDLFMGYREFKFHEQGTRTNASANPGGVYAPQLASTSHMSSTLQTKTSAGMSSGPVISENTAPGYTTYIGGISTSTDIYTHILHKNGENLTLYEESLEGAPGTAQSAGSFASTVISGGNRWSNEFEYFPSALIGNNRSRASSVTFSPSSYDLCPTLYIKQDNLTEITCGYRGIAYSFTGLDDVGDDNSNFFYILNKEDSGVIDFSATSLWTDDGLQPLIPPGGAFQNRHRLYTGIGTIGPNLAISLP